MNPTPSRTFNPSHDLWCDPCCDASYPETPVCLPSARGLLLFTPRLVSATLYSAAEVIRRTLDGTIDGTLDSSLDSGLEENNCLGEPCCDIPETHCPPPCVCRIHWTGCPGDSFRYQIQVTNTAKVDQEFTLTPVPFPCTEEVVTVTPDNKNLGPDESLKAIASFTIPDTFASFAGSRYRTRITVAGKYQQYIQVCLTVRPQQACSCHIEQGEIPKRIRARHWYHHFQCEEDCFPPGRGA